MECLGLSVACAGEGPRDWRDLPAELVQLLGTHLDSQAWAACRLVCKAWAACTHGVQLLEIDLERDAHRWMMVLTCVARLFPRLTSIVLLCGSRITPAVFAERMQALAITRIQLQELELRFIYPQHPQIGAPLDDLAGVTELRATLQLLRLAGGATPSPAFFQQLTALRHLHALEVLPGWYGQLAAGFDLPPSADADAAPAIDALGVGDAHLEGIGKLTQLKRLTVKVHPQETSTAGFAALAACGLLTQLEQLSLYDSELPSCCLSDHLSGVSKLTSLQVGLRCVADLAPLARLPNLKELSLDTAVLPALDDLVVSAARANIPARGPGAITGLCLLEQAVYNAAQLASLSQLSSLAELVLVNPLARLPTTDEVEAAELEPVLPPAPGPLPPPLDLAVLSGLHSLQLLQIDLDPKEPMLGDPLPLRLRLSAACVATLASALTALQTLDLSGLGPDLLPDEALQGLSAFQSLRCLSVMRPDSLAVPPDEQGEAAAGQEQQMRKQCLPWWRLPQGLASLCLSHVDLCGSGTPCGQAAGSRACSLTPAAGETARRMLLLPGFGLPLPLLPSCPSPLRPLSKRRRQAQPRAEPDADGPDSRAPAGRDSRSISSSLVAQPPPPVLCSCPDRLTATFGSLQALWLENAALPPGLLPRVLPQLSASLESLALLRVSGTQPCDMGLVSCLSGLTSLRLVPADHDLGGLAPLRHLHLKKLGVRLTHLQPADLGMLSSLRSLFCLSLAAPASHGQLLPGFPSAVRLEQVLDVVRDALPYCDVEVTGEPELPA